MLDRGVSVTKSPVAGAGQGATGEDGRDPKLGGWEAPVRVTENTSCRFQESRQLGSSKSQ